MSYFTERYKKICPDFEAAEIADKSMRVNTLRADEKTVVERLEKVGVKLTPQPLPYSYAYEAEFSISTTTEHLLGHFYMQGLASQTVAHVLAPEEGWTIIDMAAAPGSKTTHLAQIMNNTGRILALDKQSERLNALRNNCERLGVSNVIAIRKDARFATDLKIKADAVLLDAPCSGNYCSDEGWEEKRLIGDVKKNGRVQREMLKTAAKLVKEGGIIVYSTCSLEPEEDELVIDYAVKKLGLVVEETGLPAALNTSPGITAWEEEELDASISKCARFWPHKTKTEGFFVARLRKKK